MAAVDASAAWTYLFNRPKLIADLALPLYTSSTAPYTVAALLSPCRVRRCLDDHRIPRTGRLCRARIPSTHPRSQCSYCLTPAKFLQTPTGAVPEARAKAFRALACTVVHTLALTLEDLEAM